MRNPRARPWIAPHPGSCCTRDALVRCHTLGSAPGTPTLSAVRNGFEDPGSGKRYVRHRHTGCLGLLRAIPPRNWLFISSGQLVHPQQRRVPSWLERHPRFHAHCSPPAESGLDLVERFVRALPDRRLRRGIFRSVREPTQASDDFPQHYTANPSPSEGQ